MKIILTALFISLSVFAIAQNEVPEFGSFSPDEIAYKECPFDKDADAVVLFEHATSNYGEQWELITEHRVRFKILKEKGLDRANIHIRYYSEDEFETIRGLNAIILTYDENNNPLTLHLDGKSVFTKKLNSLYSEIAFTLPRVKVGSIVEYKYESTSKSYAGLREWIFQKDIPVLNSTYELTVLPNHEFAYRVQKNANYKIDIKPEPSSGKITYSMHDIAGLRDEAYMASENDYLQKVIFQLSGFTNYFGRNTNSTTWEETTRQLLQEESFGSQLRKDIPNGGIIAALTAKAVSPFEKMRLIHDYVRGNFTWNYISSIYASNGVKKVWNDKKGNSGELNLMLINLLKSADIEVYPILISERDHGKVNPAYPFLEQFNKVAAYVPLNGKYYILDATDKQTPSSIIPYDFLNTKGYIVDRKVGGFLDITNPGHTSRLVINVAASLSPDATVGGNASVYNFDYARIEKQSKFHEDKEKYWHGYLASYQDIKIDSFKVEGIENDTLPLVENFNLNTRINNTGEYYMLRYNLFTGYQKNPFLSQNRFSNIDFGCLHTCDFNGQFNVTDKFAVESLPKSITLRTPDNSMVFIRSIEKNDQIINVGFRIQILRAEFTPDEYELVQGFFKKMYELLDEPILLKAKP